MTLTRTIKRLQTVCDWTYRVLMFLCKLLLIGDVLVTAWAVAGRYLSFVKAPAWSEELVLTQMVYLTALSASAAIRKGTHIRMTAFDKVFTKRALMLTDLIADLLVLLLGALFLVCGIRLLRSPLCTLGTYASVPELSKFWQYLPIAIAGGSMILFELEQFLLHLEAYCEEKGKKVDIQ